MSGTPRLGSSYPSTPDSQKRRSTPASSTSHTGASSQTTDSKKTLPLISTSAASTKTANSPLIPVNLIDAPSQRFYVFAVYVGLIAWRLYDWGNLLEHDGDSLWLFIKWVGTDAIVFLYALPALRIPWMEWSNPVIMAVFLLHAILNGMLMFRIPIPLEPFLAGLVKTMYDREISVSENRVKPASLLRNSSLIMGRQIINILPEGSATLNVDRIPFCIDKHHPSAKLPIHLNETTPVLIELLRLDFDTNANETIEIKAREIQKMMKQATNKQLKDDKTSMVLEYTVKKPGVYRLRRVVDKSNLEVQRRMSDTLVLNCPSAMVRPSTPDRCVGDLSDLIVQVQGTPPLKLVYSRTINHKDQSFHFQSIQPENLVSPLLGVGRSNMLVSNVDEDLSWGRPYSIDVRLNESMTPDGRWLYSVDEVHDAAGNVANFSARGEDGEHIYPKDSHMEHAFNVHSRPTARLKGCDISNPLKVAKASSVTLPIQFDTSAGGNELAKHTVKWRFSPIDKLTAGGEHGDESVVEEFTSKFPRQLPEIGRSGLYTLIGVSNAFCEGEIREPASCLLLNPPSPELYIQAQRLSDKCADTEIGQLVDMDLTGTPPFVVHYEIIQNKQRKSFKAKIDGLRHQLELRPTEAGQITYRFTSIEDSVYGPRSLTDNKNLTLTQIVKPPASAYLAKGSRKSVACIEERLTTDVLLQGEPPFTLEYELIHNGKRKQHKVEDIHGDMYTISTDPLVQGGEYTLALKSVKGIKGCQIYLSEEVTIEVRQQRPKASFGVVDGKRKIMALEGEKVRLPLRLEGVPPWQISYRRVGDADGNIVRMSKGASNDVMLVDKRGTYELLDVSDSECPGTVDHAAAAFDIDWIARPEIRMPDSNALTLLDGKYWRREVCEGDVDAVEITLTGNPPFHVEYKQRYKPEHGSPSLVRRKIDVALGVASIPMDTTGSGLHTYEFTEVSDNFYGHDSRSEAVVIQQTVNPKPSAAFAKPGHSYTYCKVEQAGDEVIPIDLKGLPPFYLEIDIKHQSSLRPETVKIANIETNRYEFRIPHSVLSLGTHHVSVRKVRDARGCQHKTSFESPHVQVQVFDVPTIYPLETRQDYCVGERISYTLSGTPPFEIYYVFEGVQRRAKSSATSFRRIAERPGEFTITAVMDKASKCKAEVQIEKTIHEIPSVRISKGKQVEVDIHEGGEAEILFEFWGTPPFEFTYTRSTNARKGQKSRILETKHDISYEHSKAIKSSQEGTYEVVAIKDRYCSFSTQKAEVKAGQKLLQL